MKVKILFTVAVICSSVAIIAGFQLYQHFVHVKQYEMEFQELAKAVEQSPEDDKEPEKEAPAAPQIPYSENETILSDYSALFQQNQDMVGWLRIQGTGIDYPVMYTPNSPDFYLDHNFNKESSVYGVPYIAEDCSPTIPSDNLIIYGHHIKNGQMFGALMDYSNKKFYKEHKTIQFNTLTKKNEYRIIAVFKTTAYDTVGFRYYDFINAETTEEFDTFISKCKELSIYDTGESAKFGDKLITLSTCEYSQTNGRIVVVAKRM